MKELLAKTAPYLIGGLIGTGTAVYLLQAENKLVRAGNGEINFVARCNFPLETDVSELYRDDEGKVRAFSRGGIEHRGVVIAATTNETWSNHKAPVGQTSSFRAYWNEIISGVYEVGAGFYYYEGVQQPQEEIIPIRTLSTRIFCPSHVVGAVVNWIKGSPRPQYNPLPTI